MSKQNDFTKEQNKVRSSYRLWVVFRFGSMYYDKYGSTKVYYSYNNLPDSSALSKLESLFTKLHSANQLIKASIYNNRDHSLMKTLL